MEISAKVKHELTATKRHSKNSSASRIDLLFGALDLNQGRRRRGSFAKSINTLGSDYLQNDPHMVNVYLSF